MIKYDGEKREWIVKADTVEDLRAVMVEWLRRMAIGASTDMRLARSRKTEYENRARAKALEAAANVFARMRIEK